jgi:KaiC/GvpD/RAD55 family RecA-like ATPase
MDFDSAFNEAIYQAGWNVDAAYNQGDTIVRDVSKTRGMPVRMNVPRREVASTWDKWDEAKRKRGHATLAAYVSKTLSRMSPGMAVFLGPDSWTPDA